MFLLPEEECEELVDGLRGAQLRRLKSVKSPTRGIPFCRVDFLPPFRMERRDDQII